MCGTCVKLRKKHVCNLCTHKKNMCVTCVRYLKIDTEKITCVYVLYVCCAVLDSTLEPVLLFLSQTCYFLRNWWKLSRKSWQNKKFGSTSSNHIISQFSTCSTCSTSSMNYAPSHVSRQVFDFIFQRSIIELLTSRLRKLNSHKILNP